MSSARLEELIEQVAGELDQRGIPAAAARSRRTFTPWTAGDSAPGIAARIEHTALKAEVGEGAIAKLCDEALRYSFRGVCVNPIFVPEARRRLAGSGCLVITVVGFPLGANLTRTKVEEARAVVALGADEVDMVVAVGLLKQGDYRAVFDDIAAVVAAAGTAPVKVILETALLGDAEKVAGCLLAERAGASFVKTSTGFSLAGATVDDIRVMRQAVKDRLAVKASGGIRDLGTARAMLAEGADVLGTSASVEIVSAASALRAES